MIESGKTENGKAFAYAVALLFGITIGTGIWYVRTHPAAKDLTPATGTMPQAAAGNATGSAQKPATIVAMPTTAPLLGAARAGQRVVAVGEHGVVVLSDDDGRHWRQARSVPSQALLTSVYFIDDRQGWIAGHDGVVLHTTDGGETWTLQREDLDGDKPLFSIYFKDAQHGFAVGLFGTAVQTADGGATWTPLSIETGDETDHHLYAIFGSPASGLYVAGESGLICRSADGGASWTTIKTSNPGSFWAGAVLKDGTVLAAGQRGHLFVSHDQGATWDELPSGTEQSLTSISQNPDGSVLVTGLAGTLLNSPDGKAFAVQSRPDRLPLNAALPDPSGPLLFSDRGFVVAASNPG
jgi:photosystem II stability/assembly factor-like uncharacterized protein